MNRVRLEDSIKAHEGFSAKPYTDTTGNLTIGWGHKITGPIQLSWYDPELAPGITAEEATLFLAEDIESAVAVAKSYSSPAWNLLNEVRQETLVEMAFNLGTRLHSFKRMQAAIIEQDWVEAARQGLESLWRKQVGHRAYVLMARLETGDYLFPRS